MNLCSSYFAFMPTMMRVFNWNSKVTLHENAFCFHRVNLFFFLSNRYVVLYLSDFYSLPFPNTVHEQIFCLTNDWSIMMVYWQRTEWVREEVEKRLNGVWELDIFCWIKILKKGDIKLRQRDKRWKKQNQKTWNEIEKEAERR